MHVRPILAALRHHRLTVALIVLEIALACAVLCNACFVMVGQVGMMGIRSGIDEASLAVLSLGNYDRRRVADLNARVLAGLRRIDGVESVDAIDGLPFVDAGMGAISPDRGGRQGRYVANYYFGDRDAASHLGLRLLAGRLPRDADLSSVSDDHQQALVTQALARRLWPHGSPLGREMWCCQGTSSFRVIGVVRHLVHAQPRDRAAMDWSVLVPVRADSLQAGQYLLRAAPARLDEVLRKARAALATLAPDATVDDEHTGTVRDLRARYFQSNRATAGVLAGIMATLLVVTALGIVGLTGYWVQQRRKQIGVRRALGASRSDIVRHFLVENFLLVTLGLLPGAVLAYVFNILLMTHYELPHLPPGYLLVAALALWLLGQLAALSPALRAARVPPVVATRSV